jgi:outer membrane lipoprotein LolB
VKRLAVFLVLAGTLGGCAVAPVAPPPAVTADADALKQWTASGRIAVAANGEGGSGSFTWEQVSATTTLSIRGPLGAGAMRVTSDGRALAVTDSEGHRLDDAQAQALLRQRLGTELPVAELRYWMLGVPSPGSPASVDDAATPPRRVIEQSGWRIGYDTFRPSAGMSLPERFTATQGAVRLKVIVDDWQVGSAAGSSP